VGQLIKFMIWCESVANQDNYYYSGRSRYVCCSSVWLYYSVTSCMSGIELGLAQYWHRMSSRRINGQTAVDGMGNSHFSRSVTCWNDCDWTRQMAWRSGPMLVIAVVRRKR